MIKTAVILAAGMGSRISKRAGNRPKGFLMIDEKSIIEHSISKLIEAGVKTISIGTGYMKEEYEKLMVRYPQIKCVYNSRYETTGSLFTLYQFKNYIKEDFLLLESDVIYEKNALETLVNHSRSDVILASKLNGAGDEVYIEDDEDHWARATTIVYPIIKAREGIPHTVKRNILLNPGPATTTDTVKYAQIVEDICPREKQYGETMEFISAELTKFVGNPEKYTTVLFGGSGTAAVESILSSVIDNGTVVIINNGPYGERMCKIAEIYGLNYLEYKSSAQQAIDMNDLKIFIKKISTNVSYLALVHCETSTGLLNDIEQIGEFCAVKNIEMIVDAMSSYAAVPID